MRTILHSNILKQGFRLLIACLWCGLLMAGCAGSDPECNLDTFRDLGEPIAIDRQGLLWKRPRYIRFFGNAENEYLAFTDRPGNTIWISDWKTGKPVDTVSMQVALGSFDISIGDSVDDWRITGIRDEEKFPPHYIVEVNGSGDTVRTVDLHRYLKQDENKILDYESLYSDIKNPFVRNGNTMHFGLLPYSRLYDGNKTSGRYFASYDFDKTDPFDTLEVDFPDVYYKRPYAYGYFHPYQVFLNDSTSLIGFQGHPKLYIANLNGSKKPIPFELMFDQFSMPNPPEEKGSDSKVKAENGHYGPIYYRKSDGLFVRQVILPFKEERRDFESYNKSIFVGFEIEDMLNRADSVSVIEPLFVSCEYYGLGKLGFFSSNGRLNVLNSRISKAQSEKSNSLFFTQFDISPNQKNGK